MKRISRIAEKVRDYFNLSGKSSKPYLKEVTFVSRNSNSFGSIGVSPKSLSLFLFLLECTFHYIFFASIPI